MALDPKVKAYVDKGVAASRDALTKAGSAVKDFSDKGVVRLELVQLKSQLKKTYENLGLQVFEALSGKKQQSLSADDALTAGYLTEIERLRREIEKRG